MISGHATNYCVTIFVSYLQSSHKASKIHWQKVMYASCYEFPKAPANLFPC